MKNFKTGSAVIAKTVRGVESVKGKIVAINKGLKGDWYEVQPADKTKKSFKTRLSSLSAA